MFHLPCDTCSPLRGACQHKSSCRHMFQGSEPAQALLTCGLLMKCDFPSGWMDGTFWNLRVSDPAPHQSRSVLGGGWRGTWVTGPGRLLWTHPSRHGLWSP